jgi:hypothetical protein
MKIYQLTVEPGMGNIIELCAATLYPEPIIWLGFTMCITRDYKAIPERNLIEDCALEHAIDFKALNHCAIKDNGAFGVGMLRDSVRRSSKVRDQEPGLDQFRVIGQIIDMRQ